MKKHVAVAALTLALGLIACNSPVLPPAPTPSALTLTGDTMLEVGKPAQVTAVVKDANGAAITVPVTYTSDQPNVIAVDDKGQLTVRRLTATDKPVTITAKAGNVTGTLMVKTFGLEMAVGTHMSASTSNLAPVERTHVVARYRSSGAMLNNPQITLSSPDGKTKTCGYMYEDWVYCSTYLDTKATGIYKADFTMGDVFAQASAALNDRSNPLLPVLDGSATLQNRTFTCFGSTPENAAIVECSISNGMFSFANSTTLLPIVITPSSGAGGETSVHIIAYSARISDTFDTILAERIDYSNFFIDNL